MYLLEQYILTPMGTLERIYPISIKVHEWSKQNDVPTKRGAEGRKKRGWEVGGRSSPHTDVLIFVSVLSV